MSGETVVWKYPLTPANRTVLRMPHRATVLTVQTQDGTPCLWAQVNPEQQMEARTFEVYGTGHTIPPTEDYRFHVGTFQLEDGALVFHVFEVAEVPF